MKNKKLTTVEVTQCYKNARKKLSAHDRVMIELHCRAIENNLPRSRYHPNSDFVKLEILAKLGIWLNKELPAEEKK